MKALPRISESEWLVMRVLWSDGPLTSNEIVEELTEQTEWKSKTIKTLINRLMKKGAIEYTKKGRRYIYKAAVSETACVSTERRSFVQRVYGGTMKPMLAAFIEDAELSQQDITELKNILEQKERE